MQQCVICTRESEDSQYFERHHLFPGKHRRTKTDRQEDTILVCKDCGDQIHLMFSNYELRNTLDSLVSLREAMQSFSHWIQKKPLSQKIVMKKKKRKI